MAVTISGITITTTPTPYGPELAPMGPDFEALQWVVNLSLKEHPGLRTAINEGRECVEHDAFVHPNVSADVEPGAAEAWLRLSGEPLPAAGLIATRMGFLDRASIVPQAWLSELVETLVRLRRDEPITAPWLFIDPPVAEFPDVEIERPLLTDHADVLQTLDDQVTSLAAEEDESQDLIETRRTWLEQSRVLGLMSPEIAKTKRMALEQWGLQNLASWYDAALEMLTYQSSPERATYNSASDIEGGNSTGAVSVDLFRSGLITPSGVSRFDWASWGEYILRTTEVEGEQGSVQYHDQDGWVTVVWRRDGLGHPAVVAVGLSA